MKVYLALLDKVLTQGVSRPDRTGTGTKSLFGEQLKFDLSETIPIITTKKIHLKSVIHELLWFLSGSTNTDYLHQHNITIWDEWEKRDENQGDVGPIYGAQWRHCGKASTGKSVDQIEKVIKGLKEDPFSRRHMVTTWNPLEIESMSLPPCHCLFQFYVTPRKNKPHGISIHMYQRSADLFLGVPFNITSYGLLTYMVGHILGYQPQELIISFGDVHLYSNHMDQAEIQLSRKPKPQKHVLKLETVPSIFDFKYEHIKIENYQHDPGIKAPIAI